MLLEVGLQRKQAPYSEIAEAVVVASEWSETAVGFGRWIVSVGSAVALRLD